MTWQIACDAVQFDCKKLLSCPMASARTKILKRCPEFGVLKTFDKTTATCLQHLPRPFTFDTNLFTQLDQRHIVGGVESATQTPELTRIAGRMVEAPKALKL